MRAATSRRFHKDIRKLEVDERLARVRWLEAEIERWKRTAEAEWEPFELHTIPLSTIVAILECDRNLIPVEHWRPEDPYQ